MKMVAAGWQVHYSELDSQVYQNLRRDICNAGKDKAPKASNLNPKSVSENLAIVSREAFMTRCWLPIILANSDLFPSAPYPVTSNTGTSPNVILNAEHFLPCDLWSSLRSQPVAKVLVIRTEACSLFKFAWVTSFLCSVLLFLHISLSLRINRPVWSVHNFEWWSISRQLNLSMELQMHRGSNRYTSNLVEEIMQMHLCTQDDSNLARAKKPAIQLGFAWRPVSYFSIQYWMIVPIVFADAVLFILWNIFIPHLNSYKSSSISSCLESCFCSNSCFA